MTATSIHTDMAIDAYRQEEQARRQHVLAEAATDRALLLVPQEELSRFVSETEKIRQADDEREAIHQTGLPRR